MKYIGFLLFVAGIYFYFFHLTPAAEVKEAVTGAQLAPIIQPTPASPGPTNALKRPTDRTKEVLSQVQQRNGAGEF